VQWRRLLPPRGAAAAAIEKAAAAARAGDAAAVGGRSCCVFCAGGGTDVRGGYAVLAAAAAGCGDVGRCGSVGRHRHASPPPRPMHIAAAVARGGGDGAVGGRDCRAVGEGARPDVLGGCEVLPAAAVSCGDVGRCDGLGRRRRASPPPPPMHMAAGAARGGGDAAVGGRGWLIVGARGWGDVRGRFAVLAAAAASRGGVGRSGCFGRRRHASPLPTPMHKAAAAAWGDSVCVFLSVLSVCYFVCLQGMLSRCCTSFVFWHDML